MKTCPITKHRALGALSPSLAWLCPSHKPVLWIVLAFYLLAVFTGQLLSFFPLPHIHWHPHPLLGILYPTVLSVVFALYLTGCFYCCYCFLHLKLAFSFLFTFIHLPNLGLDFCFSVFRFYVYILSVSMYMYHVQA